MIPGGVERLVDYGGSILNRPAIRENFQVDTAVGPNSGHYCRRPVIIVIAFGDLVTRIGNKDHRFADVRKSVTLRVNVRVF